MIYARHSRWFERIFYTYLNLILKRNFRRITLHGIRLPDGPTLLVANHTSWWDGFWVWYVVHRKAKRRLYTMMLEEQLTKNRFLSKVGCFSVNKGAKGILESLGYASKLLQHPNHVVLIFPQGQIESAHNHRIHFQKGIAYLLQHNPDAKLYGLAMLTDYCSSKRPYLDIYGTELDRKSPEQSYAAFYSTAIQTQQELCQLR